MVMTTTWHFWTERLGNAYRVCSGSKRGRVPFAGTALWVLRTNGTRPLLRTCSLVCCLATLAQAAWAASPPPQVPSSQSSGPTPATAARVEKVPAPALSLTLEQAITTALANNPRLIAQRLEAGVSRAQIDAASVYPFNPVFGSAVRNARIRGDGHGIDQQYTLSQELELAGQRSKRRAEASATHDRVLWEIEWAEVGVVAQVRRLFFGAIYRRAKLELAESVATLNQQLLEVLERRFQAQQAGLADVSVGRVEARDAARRARLARSDYDAAKVELLRTLGVMGPVGLKVSGELSPASAFSDITPAIESLIAQAIDQRADLRGRRAEADAAIARWRLARANRLPNVSAGIDLERDESGTQFFGGTVSVPIPILNNNRGVIAQREAEYLRTAGQVTQLEAEVRQDVRAASQRYERAREVAAQNEADIRDGLGTEVDRIEDLYAQGETDLLRVYEVRQKLNQLRDAYLDSLFEVIQAESELAAAAGQPLTAFRAGMAVQAGIR